MEGVDGGGALIPFNLGVPVSLHRLHGWHPVHETAQIFDMITTYQPLHTLNDAYSTPSSAAYIFPCFDSIASRPHHTGGYIFSILRLTFLLSFQRFFMAIIWVVVFPTAFRRSGLDFIYTFIFAL